MGPSKPVTYVTVCALGGDSAFCSLRRCREGKAVEAAPKAQIESASQMPEKPIHVPRAGIEPARPFRAKGFSYHYGFRHHLCLWSGLFLHRGAGPFRCVVSSLCTFLFSEAWLKIAIGLTRYGFLEFTTFYISLFRECTQIATLTNRNISRADFVSRRQQNRRKRAFPLPR